MFKSFPVGDSVTSLLGRFRLVTPYRESARRLTDVSLRLFIKVENLRCHTKPTRVTSKLDPNKWMVIIARGNPIMQIPKKQLP